jgi:hypothetical protein
VPVLPYIRPCLHRGTCTIKRDVLVDNTGLDLLMKAATSIKMKEFKFR